MEKMPVAPKLDADVLQTLELWVESRFHAEFLAIAKMRAEMDAHKAVVEQNSAENQELLFILRKAKIFVGFLTIIEKIAVWIAKVSIAIGLVWATWKYIIMETIRQISQQAPK